MAGRGGKAGRHRAIAGSAGFSAGCAVTLASLPDTREMFVERTVSAHGSWSFLRRHPVYSPKISATSDARDPWKRMAAKPAVSRACCPTTRNATGRRARSQSPQWSRNFGKRLPASISALNWEITFLGECQAAEQIAEKLLQAILTSVSRLRSTPKRRPKSYLKFAPRFIGVSEDADAIPGLDDDELVSPAADRRRGQKVPAS